ncbi:MAG: hypothetical protein KDJ37_13015 [Hyphomicrobiaceae bacterium]|nr:hypothetical protein [Hyphomicrobiaceae bacterium]
MIPQTTVFYLHRRVNPLGWLQAFLESLARYPAGAPYNLVVLAKGGIADGAEAAIEDYRGSDPGGLIDVRMLELPDDGYDIHAYFSGAADVATRYVLFFNSYSRLLGGNWLSAYEAAIAALPKPAMVGASAAYEALDRTTPFPNRHIRSNAMMLERAYWLSLEPPTLEKRACNRFEAGTDGISRRIERAGGGLGILTRAGKLVLPPEWPKVPVYRVDQQQELLVADNRTADFALSSYFRRRKLARLAWGTARGVKPSRWPAWLAERRAWKEGRWPGNP